MLQAQLKDSHDPAGVHWHRAWKASLSGLLAAGFLYFLPTQGHPLIVIAALIFAHTNKGASVQEQQVSMLRSTLTVIVGIALLALLQDIPLLQFGLIVLLSFLSQYVARFGSQYESNLVWILILVAIAENPPLSEIPKMLLNIGLGFGLAFVCFFLLFPYNPQTVLGKIARRNFNNLSQLLKQIAGSPNSPIVHSVGVWTGRHPRADLKDRIFNLIQAQTSVLKQVRSEAKSPELLSRDRQLIEQQQQLLEAILVLEQALVPLHSEVFIDSSLSDLLKQFSDSLVLSKDNSRETVFPAQPLTAPGDQFSVIKQQIEELILNPPLKPVDASNWSKRNYHLHHLKLALKGLSPALTSSEDQYRDQPQPKISQTRKQRTRSQSWNWGLNLKDAVTRRAARTAIAVTIALVLGQLLQLPYAHWIAVSALIVSRDSVGNTLWKAQGRLVGTAVGVVAALAFYGLAFHHPQLIFITAFITIFPYLYLRPSLESYGYAKFFQQVAFVCFLSSLGLNPTMDLLEWRALNIAIGCGIGIAVALLILPTCSRPEWKQGLLKAWGNCSQFFDAIVIEYQSEEFDDRRIQSLSRQTQQSVFELKQHLEGRKHESIMTGSSLAQRLALIQANRHIYETLLYISYLTPQVKRPTQPGILCEHSRSLIQKLTIAFELMPNFVGTPFSPPLPLIDDFSNQTGNKPEQRPTPVENQMVEQPEISLILLLQQLCDAMNHYGEIRQVYTTPQTKIAQTNSTT